MEPENPLKCKTVAALLLTIPLAVLGAEPLASKNEMPRIRHLDPGQAMASFQVREGFQIKLAAAEPLVADPMAMAFDEHGRLYVVEMRGYPEKRHEKIGRVRLLTDTDNDGVFDFSRTFAEGLGWPSAIICYDGGVFVGCAPDIYFMKDTDGDGIADKKKTVFTGFRVGSPREIAPRLFNSFRWGYDNRIYGASSMNGGIVRRPDQPEAKAINLTRDDFSFDPKTLELRPESGTAQHGMSFDLRGNRYVSRNSNHLQAYLYDARYARRKSRYSLPPWKKDIAIEGPAAKIFRISPPEPWRVLRTKWRVGGKISGPVEGGGTTFGYFTSATGVTIYKGDAFPPEYVGNAFIGAPANNLVHRKLISFEGAAPVARRAEENREFIASTDNWFRPVIFENGPDGCLWMADMYRETIEVAHAIPESIKEHLDIYRGSDRGRIYRVVPKSYRARSLPDFSAATPATLVRLLEHANSWHRESAARLLYQGANPAAMPHLRSVLETSKSAPARLHALYLLAKWDDTLNLESALADDSPTVREHAIRLAENRLEEIPRERLEALANDPDARVRLQFALSLGPPGNSQLSRLLGTLGQQENDSLINAAILHSYQGRWENLLLALTHSRVTGMTDSHRELVRALLEEIGASKDLGSRAPELISNSPLGKYDAAFAVAVGLRRAKLRIEDTIAKDAFNALVNDALHDARDPKCPDRSAAIALLSFGRFDAVKGALFSLLSPMESSSVRLAAVKSMDAFDSPEIAHQILTRWKSFTPGLREQALPVLFRRSSHQLALLRAIENGNLSSREIPFHRRNALKRSRNAEIKAAAMRVFGTQTLATRTDALRKFTSSLQLPGNPDNGAKHVRERCHTCHRFQDEGHPLGPDLETVRAWTAEELLTHILDPNRKVEPGQRAFTIETKDDESFTGLIESESDSGVTLRMPNGIRRDVQRADIVSLTSQGLSLMPEGLEENLSPQDMADLIAFLKQ